MKIYKDIPIPATSRNRWSLLEHVGDSVFVKDVQDKSPLVNSANVWGKKQAPPRRFKAFYETDDGGFLSQNRDMDVTLVGVRLWRIE